MTTRTSHTEVLWSPPSNVRQTSRIGQFLTWLENDGGPSFDDYESLWRWSVTDPNDFWLRLWRYFEVPSHVERRGAPSQEGAPPSVAVVDPDSWPVNTRVEWFPEVRLNYAEAVLRLPGRADDDVVLISRSQTRPDVTLTADELRDQVARAREGLVRLGVGRGDRVAAYAPNIAETLVAYLAAASLGAIFSSCAPEFGAQSVIDRWSQLQPTVILVADGYRYGHKPVDRRDEIDEIRAALPDVRAVVWLPYLDPDGRGPDGTVAWSELVSTAGELTFDRVSFPHPLCILFSSGTTGLPKPIVHGHGGITIEHLKAITLAHDLGPQGVFFWFTTTGWMMWNYLVSGLMTGSTVVLFDGNPMAPDTSMLWHLAAELRVTYFGGSAPYFLQCRKEGLEPRSIADLSSIRGLGSTGAPLSPEDFRWLSTKVGDDIPVGSLSGGTDICTSFVGSSPLVPVYAGLLSCRSLGAAVAAFDEHGHEVEGQLGELVVMKPMPSMPVCFWGDGDGSRYRAAYFDDIPGVWRHGDWVIVNSDGTCEVTGRSDATLNRGGVRLGTSEFYSVLEELDVISESLVVHLEDDQGGIGTLVLLITMRAGVELDADLEHTIRRTLHTRLSPRHVPDAIVVMAAVPRTLTGKKMELPVKRILQGAPVSDAVAKDSLQDPAAYEDLERLAHHVSALRLSNRNCFRLSL